MKTPVTCYLLSRNLKKLNQSAADCWRVIWPSAPGLLSYRVREDCLHLVGTLDDVKLRKQSWIYIVNFFLCFQSNFYRPRSDQRAKVMFSQVICDNTSLPPGQGQRSQTPPPGQHCSSLPAGQGQSSATSAPGPLSWTTTSPRTTPPSPSGQHLPPPWTTPPSPLLARVKGHSTPPLGYYAQVGGITFLLECILVNRKSICFRHMKAKEIPKLFFEIDWPSGYHVDRPMNMWRPVKVMAAHHA